MSYAVARRRGENGDMNRLYAEDRAIHEWYRFVLSFPPHLVRTYLERFGVTHDQTVLDPFCGTGTVVVECKKLGIPSVGVEANPLAAFASQVKVDWTPDAAGLARDANQIAEEATSRLRRDGVEDDPMQGCDAPTPERLRTLPPDAMTLLLTDSISPMPLHKALTLVEALEQHGDEQFRRHERLALATSLVYSSSNLHFGPEVGVSAPKRDAAVIAPWLDGVHAMAGDLRRFGPCAATSALVHHADSRRLTKVLAPVAIDAVITSPPYPNEKDYTRATRLEAVLLGFIHNRKELQALKRGLVRSNTRGVYRDDDDDHWIAEHPEIARIADSIETRRIELGKTSGFERMYHRVTRLYFGGMARHLSELRTVLKPGARLAYVVGDQASFFRIMIRTGQLLAEIASSLGYRVDGLDLFRTRLATATREQLREEVLVLTWPGPTGHVAKRNHPRSTPARSTHRR